VQTDNQLQEINLTIEEAQKNIELMEAYHRLQDNLDFKKLILEGYYINEAADLVANKVRPELAQEHHQQMIDRLILGVGGLRMYLTKVHNMGVQAKNALDAHYRTREEIMEEMH
jgi:hypothetical protein